MHVRDMMTHSLACVRPRDSVATAAEMMRDLDVGMLPVCDDDDRPLGIVTDRDITIRATADGVDACRTPIRDIMTPKVLTCFADQPLESAAERMQAHQVRRLVVLNRDRRLAGVIAWGDVFAASGNRRQADQLLDAFCEPACYAGTSTALPIFAKGRAHSSQVWSEDADWTP